MKNASLLLICFALVASCSSIKRSQKEINKGNYNSAIDIAVGKLQKNKTKESNQELIPLLEDAFQKNSESANKRIEFLKKEGNPAHNKEIVNLYSELIHNQEKIKPLLPLYNAIEGREAHFEFLDYSSALIDAKEDYAGYLYKQSQSLMENNNKFDFRNAHESLTELLKITPNYRNAEQLQREAYAYGKDYVFIELKNRTQQIIPQRLERDLLDYNTYGLDDFWTEYHSLNRRDIDYDFDILLEFREILIAPERIVERVVDYEKEIKDGHTYQVDRNGNHILDENGNRIKIDRYITVKAKLFETIQSKALTVKGKVDYKDIKRQQITNSFPLETEFIFENIFASYEGDKRALPLDCIDFLSNRQVPFPSNEQMLIDASEDIKQRLGSILKRNQLR